MPEIVLHFDGDGCWPDLDNIAARQEAGQVIHLGNGAPPLQFALLRAGTAGGKASVTIRLDLPGGRVVLAETTLSLLVTAAKALAAADPS